MKNKLVTNTLVAVILFLAFWLVARPVWNGVFELRQEVALKKTSIDLERQVIAKLNSINNVLAEQKSNVERLEQAIPDSELKPELISIMENLASQNGLSLIAVNVEGVKDESGARTNRGREVTPKDTIGRLKVDINASGNYSSFKSWLMAVEKSLRIIDLNKITFSVAKQKTASGEELATVDPTMDYSLGMVTYILKK
ncbi:MAG: type 4a pilus biogenesis protein PilO [Patescibacteria group bacterium]